MQRNLLDSRGDQLGSDTHKAIDLVAFPTPTRCIGEQRGQICEITQPGRVI